MIFHAGPCSWHRSSRARRRGPPAETAAPRLAMVASHATAEQTPARPHEPAPATATATAACAAPARAPAKRARWRASKTSTATCSRLTATGVRRSAVRSAGFAVLAAPTANVASTTVASVSTVARARAAATAAHSVAHSATPARTKRVAGDSAGHARGPATRRAPARATATARFDRSATRVPVCAPPARVAAPTTRSAAPATSATTTAAARRPAPGRPAPRATLARATDTVSFPAAARRTPSAATKPTHPTIATRRAAAACPVATKMRTVCPSRRRKDRFANARRGAVSHGRAPTLRSAASGNFATAHRGNASMRWGAIANRARATATARVARVPRARPAPTSASSSATRTVARAESSASSADALRPMEETKPAARRGTNAAGCRTRTAAWSTRARAPATSRCGEAPQVFQREPQCNSCGVPGTFSRHFFWKPEKSAEKLSIGEWRVRELFHRGTVM